LCNVCADNIADQYIKNSKNDLAKLVDASLSGDKKALKKLQAISDYASYSNENACKENWQLCNNNAELVNNYKNWYNVTYQCKKAAISLAKYGTPELPSVFPFSTFYNGEGYVETGIVLAYEKEAKFQNMYGAMAHVTVECKYDLNKEEVVYVRIME